MSSLEGKIVCYDGVICEIIETNHRGDLHLSVIEKANWNSSPDIGSKFWVPHNDKYLKIDMGVKYEG